MWGPQRNQRGETGKGVSNNFPSLQVPHLACFYKTIKGDSQGFGEEEGNQHLPRLLCKEVVIPNASYYPDTVANI